MPDEQNNDAQGAIGDLKERLAEVTNPSGGDGKRQFILLAVIGGLFLALVFLVKRSAQPVTPAAATPSTADEVVRVITEVIPSAAHGTGGTTPPKPAPEPTPKPVLPPIGLPKPVHGAEQPIVEHPLDEFAHDPLARV